MRRQHIVYMARNVKTRDLYIGYTSTSLMKRRGRHVTAAMRGRIQCPKFHRAIKKYGAFSFEWSVLAEFDNQQQALDEEIKLIRVLRQKYNIAKGGRAGMAGNNVKPVTCLNDGLQFESEMDCAIFYGVSNVAVSDVCRGKYRFVNGKYFRHGKIDLDEAGRREVIRKTEEMFANRRRRVVARIVECSPVTNGFDKKGRSAAGPMKNARSVICVDDGRNFQSASAAAAHYDVAKSAVIELCLGKNGRKSVGVLRFAYKE